MIRRCLMLTLVGIYVALVGGCAEGPKLTRSNYDLIKEGKSNKSEVEMTLGTKYTMIGADHWEYSDEDKNVSAVIHFDRGGMVAAKEWRDGSTGEWEGQAPGIDPNPPGRTVSEQRSNTTVDK